MSSGDPMEISAVVSSSDPPPPPPVTSTTSTTAPITTTTTTTSTSTSTSANSQSMPPPPRPPQPTVAPRRDATADAMTLPEAKREAKRDAIALEDLSLPKSIITRIVKGVLPPGTQVQGQAVLALSKSATVFINHLASAANDHTLSAGKKTILPADVFQALDDIEFPFLRERLEAEFAKFTQIQASKRSAAQQKKSAADVKTQSAQTSEPASASDQSPSAEPRSKKARVDKEDVAVNPTSALADDVALDGPEIDEEETIPEADDDEDDDVEEEEDDDDNDDPEDRRNLGDDVDDKVGDLPDGIEPDEDDDDNDSD